MEEEEKKESHRVTVSLPPDLPTPSAQLMRMPFPTSWNGPRPLPPGLSWGHGVSMTFLGLPRQEVPTVRGPSPPHLTTPAENRVCHLNLVATRLLPDLALSVAGGVGVWAPCPINTLEGASCRGSQAPWGEGPRCSCLLFWQAGGRSVDDPPRPGPHPRASELPAGWRGSSPLRACTPYRLEKPHARLAPSLVPIFKLWVDATLRGC